MMHGKQWNNKTPRGGDIIKDPSKTLPGFDTAKRKTYSLLQSNKKQALQNSCESGKMGTSGFNALHTLQRRPTLIRRLEGGYITINECDVRLDTWIEDFKIEM